MRVIVPSAAPDAATFTRGSTATYIDESGVLMTSSVDQPRYQDGRLLLEDTATNLLQQSQTLDNAYWLKTRATITANAATAPDGTMTAEKLVEDTATGAHHVSRSSVSFTSGVSYTLSAYVKAVERTKGALQLGNGVVAFSGGVATCSFDLVAGTATKGTFGASAGIQALGNGWFRVWITGVAGSTASDTAFGCFLRDSSGSGSYTGDGSSGMYVWGVQLEVGSAPTSYIPTTTSTATRSAESLAGEYLVSFASTAISLPIQVLDEDTAPAWVSGTTYAVGDQVHRPSTHRVYRRLVAGAGTTAPEADTTNWLDVRSTQRWAPLALNEDTKAQVIGNLYFTLLTTEAGVGLLMAGIRAATVRVVALAPPFSSVTFDQTFTMPPQSSPYSSSYSPGNEPVLAVALPSDLPAGSQIHISLIGVPLSSGSALTTAWLRYLALGYSYNLGGTLQGSRIGIADYSRKETDEFGTTTLVPRSYAKRLNLEMTLPNSQVQSTFSVLADLRATPAMWVPAEGSALSWLATYGWLKDWGITVAYTNSSLCTLEIEGLI